MTHVERQHEAPADTRFMFANPAGGWDCYGPDEELPPQLTERAGLNDVAPDEAAA